MTQAYEELAGAKGRDVYFRAERFPARSFFGDILPEVHLHDEEVGLLDLSMSGLAVELPLDHAARFAPAQELPLALDFRGQTLFSGTGRIARIETGAKKAKLGVTFPDGYLDLSELKTKFLQLSAAAEEKLCVRKVREHVPSAYRSFVADLSYLLHENKKEIEEFVDQTSPEQDQIEAFLRTCEEKAIPQWRAFCEEGNELAAAMSDPAEVRWAKTFTEALITSETVVSPLQRRAYEKPLGYPGDYKVMDYVYEWGREGTTPYAQFVHRLALEPMRCVQTRLEKQEQIILSEIDRSGGARPFRIANLACGTAQEIRNLLDRRAFKSPVDMTLIDQEKNTLAFAYERTYPSVQQLKGLVTLKYWNASFKQLLKPNELFAGLGEQDLIYSLGLFDYLKERRAKALVRDLYAHLTPGGLLVIANLKAGGVSKWTSEFMSDWSMIYRSTSDMIQLADDLNHAEVCTETDKLDEIVFLTVRKSEGAGAPGSK